MSDNPSVTSAQKYKVSLQNPRTGKLLTGDLQYDSLEEAQKAAQSWQEAQFLKHWHVVIQESYGTPLGGDRLHDLLQQL